MGGIRMLTVNPRVFPCSKYIDHQPKKAKFEPEKHSCSPLYLDNEDEVSMQPGVNKGYADI